MARGASIFWAICVGSACLPPFDAALPQPIRDVTPAGVTRVYREENKRNLPETGEKPGTVRVQNDGTLETPNGPIRLYGVKLPALREFCRTGNGARWTCGVRATGALRGFIDAQPVACEPPKSPQEASVRVCWVGGTNIALWLLQQGWADIADGQIGKEYRDALATAKARGVGLWSEGRVP